jgi:5-methylcytosine-specific restriction endonuclease McrA
MHYALPKDRTRNDLPATVSARENGVMRTTALRVIFEKTNGHCHFCGDPIAFEHRGWSRLPDGHWEVDHVAQRGKGGGASVENCLPACTMCNRLRWSRTGNDLRELLLMGLVALDEVRKGSELGRQLLVRRDHRLERNRARRRT